MIITKEPYWFILMKADSPTASFQSAQDIFKSKIHITTHKTVNKDIVRYINDRNFLSQKNGSIPDNRLSSACDMPMLAFPFWRSLGNNAASFSAFPFSLIYSVFTFFITAALQQHKYH
jgi:hypothetical protein